MGEKEFQSWYAGHAKQLGIDPNPDDPRHFYDYRAAFRAGSKPDKIGHWPSQFKREGHPNMIVGGVNTKTGKPVGGRKVPRKIGSLTGRRATLGGIAKVRAGRKLTDAEESARVDALMNKAAAERQAQRQGSAPKTPQQIRSEKAAALRKKVEPSFITKLIKALGG